MFNCIGFSHSVSITCYISFSFPLCLAVSGYEEISGTSSVMFFSTLMFSLDIRLESASVKNLKHVKMTWPVQVSLSLSVHAMLKSWLHCILICLSSQCKFQNCYLSLERARRAQQHRIHEVGTLGLHQEKSLDQSHSNRSKSFSELIFPSWTTPRHFENYPIPILWGSFDPRTG